MNLNIVEFQKDDNSSQIQKCVCVVMYMYKTKSNILIIPLTVENQ